MNYRKQKLATYFLSEKRFSRAVEFCRFSFMKFSKVSVLWKVLQKNGVFLYNALFSCFSIEANNLSILWTNFKFSTEKIKVLFFTLNTNYHVNFHHFHLVQQLCCRYYLKKRFFSVTTTLMECNRNKLTQ